MPQAAAIILQIATPTAQDAASALTAQAEHVGTVSGAASVGKLTADELRAAWKAIPQQSYGSDIFKVVNDNSAYTPATLTDQALSFSQAYLNFIRLSAGISPVSFDATLNANAAQGALILAKLGEGLSHYPSTPSGVTDAQAAAGKYACSTSNLSYSGSMGMKLGVLQMAIQGQTDDSSSSSNLSTLGHRRWLLNPAASTMGIGTAYTNASSWDEYYTSVRVFSRSDSDDAATYGIVQQAGATDYDFVAWPASGAFANNVFDMGTPWSVTLNPSEYKAPVAADVSVTVTRVSDGASWTMTSADATPSTSSKYLAVENSGYGVSNCIIFNPGSENVGASSYEGAYKVDIAGLKTAAGQDARLSYQVDFFDADASDPDPSDSGDPGNPDDPSDPGVDIASLSLDSLTPVTLAAEAQGVYSFTPQEAGYYRFFSTEITGEGDPNGMLVNAEGDMLAAGYDSGEGLDFSFECELTAGATYFLVVEPYESTALNCKVGVEKCKTVTRIEAQVRPGATPLLIGDEDEGLDEEEGDENGGVGYWSEYETVDASGNEITVPYFEFYLSKICERILVTAHYADGTSAEVTYPEVSYDYDCTEWAADAQNLVTVEYRGQSAQVSMPVTGPLPDLSQAIVVTPKPTYVYTGKAIAPGVTVTLDGQAVPSSAYDLEYRDNVNAGYALVIVVSKGEYTGVASGTFFISKAKIASAKFSTVKAKKFTGKAITPKPTVKFGGKKLKAGTDYTLTYKSNKKRGTAKIIVKGKGNFKGKKVLKFKIE